MIYIHEIDNDGRGANTWDISHNAVPISSTDSFQKAIALAMYLAKEMNTTVTIYPIEWYYKEHDDVAQVTPVNA